MNSVKRSHDRGIFSIKKNVKILKVEGSPHMRGFQHGYLLAPEIKKLVHGVLDGAAAVIAKTIHCTFREAKERMDLGLKAAEPFFPADIKEEIKGISSGLLKAGVTEPDFRTLLLWNTMYDQWCIYAHPKHWDPFNPGIKAEYKGGMPGTRVLGGTGCSSFSAWGEAAGGDGSLIFGKNMDNLNLPGVTDNRILLIVNPDDGYSHACMTHPGMAGIDGGFNEKGISMMTQFNPSIHETMEGCGIGTLSRTLLKSAENINEAHEILTNNPRCTGIAYHVADAKAPGAAVIEVSSEKATIRLPEKNSSCLWTSNHSNSYPGWINYSGYNMVNDQAPVYELESFSTIAEWQNSLRNPENLYVAAPSRFGRYRTLLNEYRGNIGIDNAIAILGDRLDAYSGEVRAKYTPSTSNNVLATICAFYPEDKFFEDEPARAFTAHVANLWSLVIYPEKGDFWIAANDFPAQYGGYEHFNLFEEL